MWKEMRKGKCKTKKKACTLHLQDGRGEKGSDGERRKASDGGENMKIRRWRRGG